MRACLVRGRVQYVLHARTYALWTKPGAPVFQMSGRGAVDLFATLFPSRWRQRRQQARASRSARINQIERYRPRSRLHLLAHRDSKVARRVPGR